jgi:hypothetical protein
MRSPTAPSPAFWLGAGLAALVITSLSFWVASREWFSQDDFAFLSYVRITDPWSWRAVFLPFDERFWTFYRPLSMETFFWVGYRLFGFEAFGFFALSLGLHFLSAGLVYRLARQLGFDARVALATALLAVSRHGSLGEIYYASVFMYVGEVFFSLVSISFFLDYLRRGRLAAQLASCLGLVLALLCNEVAVVTPALLAWVALGAGQATIRGWGGLRLLRALLPQGVLSVLYLVFRFHWIVPAVSPELYTPHLGSHVLVNYVRILSFVFGDVKALLAALALATALLVAVMARWDAHLHGGPLRVAAACAAWIATVLAPFALLPFAQPRWAMPLAVPVCLLLGALLEAFRRSYVRRHAQALEAGLLVLVLASLPYGELLARATDPVGAYPRRIVEWVDAQKPPLSSRAVLVLLYGAPGLANAAAAERFRYLAYGGGVLNAAYPKTQRVMRFVDLSRRPPRNAIRPDSIYLGLAPDLAVARADARLLDRELPRRFELRR